MKGNKGMGTNKGSLRHKRNSKNIAIYSIIIILAVALSVSGYFVFFHDMVVEGMTPSQTNVNDVVSSQSGEIGVRETKSGIKIDTQINLDDVMKSIDVTAPNARKEGFYNFLVVGRDKAGLNTDVIMVASFDMANNKAAIVQIPRDTYIEASPLAGNKKINAVFSTGYSSVRRAGGTADECIEGGMTALSDALLSSFGIVIDRYVHVNIQGFREIVDAIGGVEVTVQQDMYYSDPEQGLDIALKAGTQTLNGAQAEGFVRFRYGYVNADLGRMDAQKIFMTSLMKKLISPSTVSKLPKLVSVVSENTVTDISVADMTTFATAALKLDLGSISMFTMQGEPVWYNKVSYVSMYPKANLELVNNHFNVFNSPITIDDIKIRLLVDEPDGYTIAESTADDISKEPPKLSFVGGKKGAVTGDVPAGSASDVPEQTQSQPSEQMPDEETQGESQGEGELPTEETSYGEGDGEQGEISTSESIEEGSQNEGLLGETAGGADVGEEG